MNFYIGVVEDNKDPNRRGRIKVRVQTLYNEIATEDIPYASPVGGLAGKSFEVPAIGKLVNVFYLDKDFYNPYYLYSENYNVNLQKKLLSLSDEEYVDFISLIFDEKTQIYVQGDELSIDQLINKITINNKSINLELKDSTRRINLGSKTANQSAVLGDNFFEWMDKFIDTFSSPTGLIGNLAAPILKPQLDKLFIEYKLLRRNKFLSDYVKIVDNEKIELSRNIDTSNEKSDVDLSYPTDDNDDYNNKENLEKNINKQNKKACEELGESAPTKIKPIKPNVINPELPNTKDENNKVWSKNAQDKINKLHPVMRPYATAFLNDCEAAGIKLMITSGFRTIEQQEVEYKKDKKNAKPGKSWHNYGLAIDVSPTPTDWETVGNIGEKIGLRWGRNIKNYGKPWHFDMQDLLGLSTNEVYRRYKKGNTFFENGIEYVKLDNIGLPETPEFKFNEQPYIVNNDKNKNNVKPPCADKFNDKSTIEQSEENEEAPNNIEDSFVGDCYMQAEQKILSLISKGEGTTNITAAKYGLKSGYDVIFNYGQHIPDYKPSEKPLTSYTINEVFELQDIMNRTSVNGYTTGPSPVGKYQINKDTLKGILSNFSSYQQDTKFSPNIQDEFALFLIGTDVIYNYLNNEYETSDQIEKELTRRWSSLEPSSSTSLKSYTISNTELKSTLQKIKNDFIKCKDTPVA
jgi:peptidoglycan L-alanyl-D-glutamate endopeptidase CwlK